MAYTPTNWTTGDTITATKLNKMEQGIAEGGGGGYDLVLLADATTRGIGNLTTSDISVVKGDILDCEEKMVSGEPVNAILVVKGSWSWKPSTANTQFTGHYLPLTVWEGPYCLLYFGMVYGNSANSASWYFTIGYDYESGEITNIAAQGHRTI